GGRREVGPVGPADAGRRSRRGAAGPGGAGRPGRRAGGRRHAAVRLRGGAAAAAGDAARRRPRGGGRRGRGVLRPAPAVEPAARSRDRACLPEVGRLQPRAHAPASPAGRASQPARCSAGRLVGRVGGGAARGPAGGGAGAAGSARAPARGAGPAILAGPEGVGGRGRHGHHRGQRQGPHQPWHGSADQGPGGSAM
ncbi:MAG: Putative RNA polymerase sigma factor, partial [uncultured Frankineae bacterium]